MSKTSEIIQKTLNEIEKTSITTDSKPKTAEEVKNILLNISGNDNGTAGHAVRPEMKAGEMTNNEFYFDMDSLRKHKDNCNRHFSVSYYRGIMPSWKRFNKPVIFMKRVIRKLCRSLIEPIVEDQNNFNASTTNALNALYNNEVVTEAFICHQLAVNNQVAELIRQQEIMKQQMEQLTEELSLYVKKDAFAELVKHDPVKDYEEIDYFDFETNFRGSQNCIKERLKDYVKYFPKTGTVVDLGCGRGEFLELLEENSINAVGVDTYSEFVDYCTKKGHRVFNENAVEYLKSLEEQSITGVFAAQVVEHLSTNELVGLCKNAYEKLAPGGVLVFETPNPTNLAIYLNGYYMDPTHHNPVHPKTLEYLLKKAGFREVDIIFTEQSKVGYKLPVLNASGAENLKEFNDGINLISDMLFGSQDYAVIARK